MRTAVSLSIVMIGLLTSGFCFEEAGGRYDVPPEILEAISRAESNMNPHAVNENTNGSIDYCHMQINSLWEKHLDGGWEYLSDPCYCTMVGAWILKQCIDRYGLSENAIVCYHTGKSLPELTPERKIKALRYLDRIDSFIPATEDAKP